MKIRLQFDGSAYSDMADDQMAGGGLVSITIDSRTYPVTSVEVFKEDEDAEEEDDLWVMEVEVEVDDTLV